MHGLDVIAQTNALLARLLIEEAGCTGLYYCVQSGEENRMTEDMYRKFISPSDRYVLDLANRYSDNNILHCCGWAGEHNRLGLWAEYPSKAVNWAVHVEELSLYAGRTLFGNRCCLGGFETLHLPDDSYQGLLYTGAKEEIQEAVRDIILAYGKQGLMLGGDCILSPNFDNERIRWVVDAARSL